MAAASTRARDRDPGLTLVEILVAVALMGIGVIAVLGALGTATRGSSAHEVKVTGLAALETANSAIQVRATSCDQYQSMVDAALADAELDVWTGQAPSVTASAVCGAELDVVTVAVAFPGGGGRSVEVVVGGPRPGTGGGPGDDTGPPTPDPVGDGSCSVSSVTGTPPVVEWLDPVSMRLGTDVVVTVGTSGNCMTVRGVMQPLDSGPWFPALNEVSPGVWEFVVGGGLFGWAAGEQNAQIENLRSTGWGVAGTGIAFSVPEPVDPACQIVSAAASPNPSRWQNASQRRLRNPLSITAATSGTCAGLWYRVDTGDVVIGPVAMAGGDGAYSGSIAGHPSGPSWTLGTKVVEFLDADGVVLGTTTFEVQS